MYMSTVQTVVYVAGGSDPRLYSVCSTVAGGSDPSNYKEKYFFLLVHSFDKRSL